MHAPPQHVQRPRCEHEFLEYSSQVMSTTRASYEHGLTCSGAPALQLPNSHISQPMHAAACLVALGPTAAARTSAARPTSATGTVASDTAPAAAALLQALLLLRLRRCRRRPSGATAKLGGAVVRLLPPGLPAPGDDGVEVEARVGAAWASRAVRHGPQLTCSAVCLLSHQVKSEWTLSGLPQMEATRGKVPPAQPAPRAKVCRQGMLLCAAPPQAGKACMREG